MGKIKNIKKPGKKFFIGAGCILIVVLVAVMAVMLMSNQKNVEFQVLSEKEIPQEISGDVLPEYRSLERALACMVDEKVYVVVTRGEKPASGFKVDIDKMKLQTENNKETLIVYAVFKDPASENSMSQVINYPVKVAQTELKTLPDEIELRVQYEE